MSAFTSESATTPASSTATPARRSSRTRVRARLATCRQASGLRSTASAISANGTPNTSAITNTTRSTGVSDSSTRRNPNVRDSASSARWAGSAPSPVASSTATTGSGSHGPT